MTQGYLGISETFQMLKLNGNRRNDMLQSGKRWSEQQKK